MEDVIAGGPDFEALVVEENDVGLWIWMPDPEHGSREVTLLKWEYFGAARLEYERKCHRRSHGQAFNGPVEHGAEEQQWRKRNLNVISRTAT